MVAVRRGPEALDLARRLDRPADIVEALQSLATVELFGGDRERAATLIEEAVAVEAATGAVSNPFVSYIRGAVEHRRGHLMPAAAFYEDALTRFRSRRGSTVARGYPRLSGRCRVRSRRSRHGAASLWRSPPLVAELKDGWGIADALVGVVDVATATGQPERAATLLGAAEALYERAGIDCRPMTRRTTAGRWTQHGRSSAMKCSTHYE